MTIFGAETAVLQGFRKAMALPLLVTTILGAGAIVVPAAAQAQETRSYDIPAGPLAVALNRFGEAANVELIYDAALAEGVSSGAIKGSFGTAEALSRLLVGTGLTFRQDGSRAFTLERAPQSAGDTIQLGPVRVEGAGGDADGQALTMLTDSALTEESGSYRMTGPTTTATKLRLTLQETPQSISVITRQQLDDQALTSVAEALQQAPGISVQFTGSERFAVLSRGYAIDSYQVDGIPTTVELQTQDVAQSMADMAIYDHVEILRGASGLMAGAGDPSGTLNLVRKRPTAEFQGSATASLGSWDRYRMDIDLSGPIAARGAVRARVVGAYQANDSYIDFYSQKKVVLMGVVEADLSATTTVRVGVDYLSNKPRGTYGGLGLPLFYSNGEQTEFSRSKNIASRDNRFDVEAINAFAVLEQRLPGDWSMRLSANQMESKRNFQTVMGLVSGGFADKVTGKGVSLWVQGGDSRQSQTGIDARIQGPYHLFGREHELVVGAAFSRAVTKSDYFRDVSGLSTRYPFNLYSWQHWTAQPEFSKYYDNDTYQRELAAYAATNFHVTDEMKLIAGVRVGSYMHDYKQIYAVPSFTPYNQHVFSENKAVATPYAALTYAVTPDHNLYVSYTSIYTPQSQRDRNGNYLSPRTGANYELGLKSSFLAGRLTSSLAVYQIRQDNLAVADDGFLVPGTDDVAAYRAVKGAKTNGFDAELTGEILPFWNMSASYTYSHTEDNTGVRVKTIMPEHMAKIWTNYRFQGPLHGLTIGGGVNWQSAMFLTTTPRLIGRTVTGRQGDYAVVNTMAGYAFNEKISVSINVNNLFDRKYISSLDTNFNTFMYGSPRSALATLKYGF